MSDVPPQCRMCVDFWVRESRGMDEFLTVSRGGHIPEVHQKNYVKPHGNGESSSSHGGSNPNIKNGAPPRGDDDDDDQLQMIHSENVWLRNEVDAWRKKYSKADQEIKQLKAVGWGKRAKGLDSYKSLPTAACFQETKHPKKNPQKNKNKDSSTCMPVTF